MKTDYAAALRAVAVCVLIGVCVAGLHCPSTKTMTSAPDELGGVGLELGMEGNIPVVVGVVPGGPAERAAVQVGDRLIAINGEPVPENGLANTIQLLRGRPNTPVRITVRPLNRLESKEISIRREILRKVEPGKDHARSYRPSADVSPE